MRPSLFQQVKTILTLTCDQSSRLVSDSQERELLRYERIALRLHMSSCKGCLRMRLHFNLLRVLAARLRSGKTPQSASLPRESRERIQRELDG